MNLHDTARALAARLDQAGLSDDAAAIRDVIDFSSTGSEIAYGLRHHLRQVATRADAPPDLSGDARALAEAVDRLLSH